MGTIIRVTIIILLIWVFLYTVSYGTWTWKESNRLGGVAVYLLAIITIVFSIYVTFFRFG